MSLVATFVALAVVIGLTAFSGWRGSRPPDLIRGPRMAPWRFLMLIGITVAIFLLIHLINLAGLDTSAAAPRF
jgi:hypothetical protein